MDFMLNLAFQCSKKSMRSSQHMDCMNLLSKCLKGRFSMKFIFKSCFLEKFSFNVVNITCKYFLVWLLHWAPMRHILNQNIKWFIPHYAGVNIILVRKKPCNFALTNSITKYYQAWILLLPGSHIQTEKWPKTITNSLQALRRPYF